MKKDSEFEKLDVECRIANLKACFWAEASDWFWRTERCDWNLKAPVVFILIIMVGMIGLFLEVTIFGIDSCFDSNYFLFGWCNFAAGRIFVNGFWK